MGLVKRERLFRTPDRSQVTLSPDGAQVAYLAEAEGVVNVFTADAATGGVTQRTKLSHHGVRLYSWLDDATILYYLDEGGTENWHIHALDLASGRDLDLTPFGPDVQARIVHADPDMPERVLLEVNARDPRHHDLHVADATTGACHLLEESPGYGRLLMHWTSWLVDHDGNVRGGATRLADGGFSIEASPTVSAPRSEVLLVPFEDVMTTNVLGFDEAGTSLLLLTSIGQDLSRLATLDLASGQLITVHSDTEHLGGAVLSPRDHSPMAVLAQGARTQVLPVGLGLPASLDAFITSMSGDVASIEPSRDEARWLVSEVLDGAPPAYHLHDVQAHAAGHAAHLFDAFDGFDDDIPLAVTTPIEFAARDGRSVQGYISRPPDAQGPLPCVLKVHGGPWGRDHWGWHAEMPPDVVWLTNRGYAVLQVNFRGSNGFGKSFLNAGDREWGAAMHTDLLDGLDHVVELGWVDPDRVAINGRSYGGYAALVGAAFTPDVFRCAVDIVGPSNLVTLIESIPPYWESMREDWHRRIGNPATEREFLESRSPLHRADDITIPVLVAQGANDPRVKRAESDQMVAALAERGIEHEYLVFEDEGHVFTRAESNQRMFAAMERFLARHLGGIDQDG